MFHKSNMSLAENTMLKILGHALITELLISSCTVQNTDDRRKIKKTSKSAPISKLTVQQDLIYVAHFMQTDK